MNIYPAYQFTIIEFNNYKQQKEIELLLWSQNIQYQKQFKGTPTIIIANTDTDKALDEISAYLTENQNWPPKTKALKVNQLPTHAFLINTFVLFLLALFHFRTIDQFTRHSYLQHGRFSAEAVLNGEWYRLITAQMLHGDDAHLFSNVASLFLFLTLATPALGYGLIWLLILLGGGLGNLLNAFFYQSGHYSIGASTAVFSAIGLFGVIGIKERLSIRTELKSIYVPIIGVLGLYAMLGSNPNTDVFAHLFGLLSGIILGVVTLPLIHSKFINQHSIQFLLFLVFITTIFTSWASLPIK